MNAELTAENKPAYTRKVSIHIRTPRPAACGTHEDERCVQVLVILLRILSVKHVGLFAIYGEKVGGWIVSSQRFEELLQGGMEAICGFKCSIPALVVVAWDRRTILDRAGRPQALALAFCLEREVPLLALMWEESLTFGVHRPAPNSPKCYDPSTSM